jgi:hypothetical protein
VPDSFKSIRSWEGSKDRAFEEICYQLLREPDDLPPGMVGHTVRTGNPDGGVEWYADTADGQEWGWQAKYIEDIDSLLGAMKKTVERVVKERSRLTKLTFCIPTNLSSGTAGGTRRPGGQRYANAVASWKKDITGVGKIEFDLKQGSDLLDRLVLPKHAGRVWFWWNEPFLGAEWLAKFQRKQADYAGERYRPALQVDVPIQDDLSALGFSDSYFKELRRYTKAAADRLADLAPPSAGLGDGMVGAYQQIVDVSRPLADLLNASAYQAVESDPLEPLATAEAACMEALDHAQKQLRAAETAKDAETADQTKPAAESELFRSYSFRLSRASNALYSLQEFLDSSASRAVRQRFYFLTGSAGTGKTHLCLDSTARALAEDRPAIVLFGGPLGASDLWTGICDQLGLPALGADQLLGALEAVAEASSLNGRRFVIMIDALNDTTTEDYWATRLPALRAAFAPHPFLSLLVSCRDTYLDYVDSEDRRRGFERVHPGFAGREIEATHKYFQHYGLSEPQIPLLLPEFTIPLFLLIYCVGLQEEGLTVPPAGHEGRIEIFERFRTASLRRVMRKLRLATDRRLRAALGALLDEMSATGRETVSFERAEELTAAQVPDRAEWPDTALGALLSEGLLNDEMVYTEGARTRSVRITYQAFSDFLILQRRLASSSEGAPPDAAFAEWLESASWGIREASAVLLPERYAVELPDLLEPVLQQQAAQGGSSGLNSYDLGNLDLMAVRSLPYRCTEAVTERSIELLNRHITGSGNVKELFDVVFACAPQPDSMLNGDGLHRYLGRRSMAQRDASFGIAMYHELDEESSLLSRLARWAAGGPYPGYETQVVELACIPLAWMFSSPNRYARDWITKALAQLLSGHLDVAARLIERFASVNDPYVLERVMGAAYGAVLRGGLANQADAATLASTVERHIFGSLQNLNADALMLDSARGIIEWAVSHGLLAETALAAARPPYGFRRPGNAPTRERLERMYPYGEGTTDQTSYASIFFSALEGGDFGRYVIESGMSHFSRTPLSQPLPVPQQEPPRRFLATRWKKFLRSLAPEQRSRAETLIGITEPDVLTAMVEMNEFISSLTAEQIRLLFDSWQQPSRSARPRDRSYSSKLAQRWVLQRTMTLGWKPEFFGHFDRYINYSDASRTNHKRERFGKKYQWIAYHELLARVADNYHFVSLCDDETDQFDGIYQVNDREIDPSLPPVPFRLFHESAEGDNTWPPLDINLGNALPDAVNFDNYGSDYQAFLNDHATLPKPDGVARISDDAGQPWIVLYAYHMQKPPKERDKVTATDQQYYHLYSWMVENAQLKSFVDALPSALLIRLRSFDLIDTNGHIDCCYIGEIGRREMRCPHRQEQPSVVDAEAENSPSAAVTFERYAWEGGIWDCSIENSAHTLAPSTFLHQTANLHWSGTSRSWCNETGTVICYIDIATVGHSGEMLLAKEDWLRRFLADHDMGLAYAMRGEREHRGQDRADYTWLEFDLTGTYHAGNLSSGEPRVALKTNQG